MSPAKALRAKRKKPEPRPAARPEGLLVPLSRSQLNQAARVLANLADEHAAEAEKMLKDPDRLQRPATVLSQRMAAVTDLESRARRLRRIAKGLGAAKGGE